MILVQLCRVVMVGITMMSVSNALDEVLQHPKSKLVAAGVEVTFHCQLADHLTSYWVIDRLPGVMENFDKLQNRGFNVSQFSWDGITTLSLRVTATMDKNGTVISCSSEESVRTENAVLLVIEDPPISPNPSTENSNATSILLKWSPPFLWPSYSIDFYNISVMNSGLVTHNYLLNATFVDDLVSFIISAEDSNAQSCHVLEILLSAVSSDTEGLTTFHVNGNFIPTPSKSDLTDLDITVLFKSDRTPIVNINVYLSERICSYSGINYTFIIDANSNNESTLGPYQQNGSNTISKTFTSDFKKDRDDYNLTAVIGTIAGSIVSDTYYFNTTLQQKMYPCRDQQQPDANVYKLVMIISLSVVALISLTFILFTFRVTLVWIRERHGTGKLKRIIESARGIHNAMVQNPIYEGPLYETLDTHRTVNTLATATKNTSLNHTTNTASEETAKSSNSSPTLHYVKQTCVPQSISHAHISPTEGHNTSIQCHASQYSEQGDGNLSNLTVAVPMDMEEKYMIMTQANTKATDMFNH